MRIKARSGADLASVGAEVDLRAGDGAAGKAAAIVSGAEAAFRDRGG